MQYIKLKKLAEEVDLFSDDEVEEGTQPISHEDYERLIQLHLHALLSLKGFDSKTLVKFRSTFFCIKRIAIKVLSIKIRNNFHRFNWISLLIIMVPTSVRYIIYIRESTPTINLFFTELMPPRSSAGMNISVNPTRVCINGNLCLTIRTFLRCRCSRFFFFVMIQLFSRTIHNSHNRKDHQCHDQEIQYS